MIDTWPTLITTYGSLVLPWSIANNRSPLMMRQCNRSGDAFWRESERGIVRHVGTRSRYEALSGTCFLASAEWCIRYAPPPTAATPAAATPRTPAPMTVAPRNFFMVERERASERGREVRGNERMNE